MTQKVNITWRNHYIPQFILKNFLDFKINKLHICDKSLGENQEPIQRITNSAGYTEHLYTIENDDGNPTDLIEKYLGTIETPASIIIEKIISQNNILLTDKSLFRPLQISQDELDKLALFMAHQAIRTPKNFNLVAQTIHGMEHILKQYGEDEPNLNAPKKSFSHDELLPFIFNESNIKEFIKVFKSYSFFIIMNNGSNFIIGDSGICNLINFGHAQNEIYFPISSRISIMGIRKKFSNVMEISQFFQHLNKQITGHAEILKDINVASIRDSYKLIFSSKAYDKESIKNICSYGTPRMHLSTGMGVMIPDIDRTSRWKKNKF